MSQPTSDMTEVEYLDCDRASDFKREFADGEIYAMSGTI